MPSCDRAQFIRYRLHPAFDMQAAAAVPSCPTPASSGTVPPRVPYGHDRHRDRHGFHRAAVRGQLLAPQQPARGERRAVLTCLQDHDGTATALTHPSPFPTPQYTINFGNVTNVGSPAQISAFINFRAGASVAGQTIFECMAVNDSYGSQRMLTLQISPSNNAQLQ